MFICETTLTGCPRSRPRVSLSIYLSCAEAALNQRRLERRLGYTHTDARPSLDGSERFGSGTQAYRTANFEPAAWSWTQLVFLIKITFPPKLKVVDTLTRRLGARTRVTRGRESLEGRVSPPLPLSQPHAIIAFGVRLYCNVNTIQWGIQY